MAGRTKRSMMTIGEMAARSGIPVTTIRAWELRYGLLSPSRSRGGHRRYGPDDLRRLCAVKALVDEGVTLPAATDRVMADLAAPSGDGDGEGGGDGSAGPAGSAGAASLPVPGIDPGVLRAAYGATRALLFVRSPDEAVDVVVALVGELGGTVAAADGAGPDGLPIDVSLGERPPLVPVAEPYSLARLRLEQVLPTVVGDARRAAAMARVLASAGD